MKQVVPTVTAINPHLFRSQLERIEKFAKRIHIDLSDGKFSPVNLTSVEQIYWNPGTIVDLHVMAHRPDHWLYQYQALKPNCVIIHAEAEEGDTSKLELFSALGEFGIKRGIALLPDTQVDVCKELVSIADHVLIFAGQLGFQGGQADLGQLDKIHQIKELNPEAEIGWDGGVDADNITLIATEGVDVLNSGGFIHSAEHPQDAYAILVGKLSG